MSRALARGHGFGLRVPHYPSVLEHGVHGVELVEAVTENFLGRGGRPRAVLERVRRDVPVALHGVSLSIGGVSPLNGDYLVALHALCEWIEPADRLRPSLFRHLGIPLRPRPLAAAVYRGSAGPCRGPCGGRSGSPGPKGGARKCLQLRDVRGEPAFSEWEFLAEVARRADCDLLLDINNVYVSAYNHGFGASATSMGSLDRVAQFHLAGHSDEGAYLLDDHGSVVPPPVWALHGGRCRGLGPPRRSSSGTSTFPRSRR